MPDFRDRRPIENWRPIRMAPASETQPGDYVVPLLEQDRERLHRCLSGDKAAWRELWRKNLPVVRLAVEQAGGANLTSETKSAAIRDIANQLADNDFRVLRQFRGNASLTVYLAVHAQRIAASHFAVLRLRKSA